MLLIVNNFPKIFVETGFCITIITTLNYFTSKKQKMNIHIRDMKHFAILTLLIIMLASCENSEEQSKSSANEPQITASTDTLTNNYQWYVYNNAVNGYNVSILARFNYNDIWCLITVYLEKESAKYAVDLKASYDSFYPYGTEKDTIYIDNPTHPDSTWFLDPRTVVTFADVNFDGEKELILCGFPRPDLGYDPNFLDSEDYTVYKVTNDSIEQIHNMLFDKLSKGVGRTDYIIDTVNKIITLIGYSWAYGYDKEIYSFRNGEPYKLDYIRIDYDYNDSLYENPHSTSYHFNLPSDTAKFEYVIDSIYGLI